MLKSKTPTKLTYNFSMFETLTTVAIQYPCGTYGTIVLPKFCVSLGLSKCLCDVKLGEAKLMHLKLKESKPKMTVDVDQISTFISEDSSTEHITFRFDGKETEGFKISPILKIFEVKLFRYTQGQCFSSVRIQTEKSFVTKVGNLQKENGVITFKDTEIK
ncbi:hypothetical protein EIN_040050 [Entamoeba invadens IP1]|uniref:Uncharacterized protein n=1 Tax=Entamoeba invadens IP1 TaxID=370355 RepID=A0A0A1U1T3_ENTIV|nr:hypothetical protein EIN_040050 [Entamoeba invadens IP1]ELP85481.1 hypothetical protein EIN_040050 [Entamoeba invadens IP1]|eukprot:XP_004184827.1 hypothetical protein EIN_040050 [Entamoeba invadens IP1]